MIAIIMSASMVRHLLHIRVSLVHVELRTASTRLEALRITIMIVVKTRAGSRHVHKVEVQITATCCALPPEIHVDRECLADKRRLVEVLLLAVICGWVPHEVESVWGRELDSLAAINDSGPWQIVCILNAILVDQQFPLLNFCQGFTMGKEGLGVLDESLLLWPIITSIPQPTYLEHGRVVHLCCTSGIPCTPVGGAGQDAAQAQQSKSCTIPQHC